MTYAILLISPGPWLQAKTQQPIGVVGPVIIHVNGTHPSHQHVNTFDLLTSKVVSESRVTWATSVPTLVLLGLSVLDVRDRQTYIRRQTDVTRASSLNAPGGA